MQRIRSSFNVMSRLARTLVIPPDNESFKTTTIEKAKTYITTDPIIA